MQRENEGMKAIIENYVFSLIYSLQGQTFTNNPKANQENQKQNKKHVPTSKAESVSLRGESDIAFSSVSK